MTRKDAASDGTAPHTIGSAALAGGGYRLPALAATAAAAHALAVAAILRAARQREA